VLFGIGQLGEGGFHAPKPDMSGDERRHIDPALGDVVQAGGKLLAIIAENEL